MMYEKACAHCNTYTLVVFLQRSREGDLICEGCAHEDELDAMEEDEMFDEPEHHCRGFCRECVGV